VNVISSVKLQIALQVALKVSYRKDVLLIHSIDIGDSSAAIFAVEPIHRSLHDAEMEEIKAISIPFPDLNSHIMCHYVSVSRPDTKREGLVIVDIGQPDMIKFTDDGKSVSFTVYNNWGTTPIRSYSATHGDSGVKCFDGPLFDEGNL
jgi:hypothetical protein